MVAGASAVSGNRAFAQIAPDTTLGAERSVINSEVSNGLPRDRIEGGATRGINLFHSFHQFNVSEGQSVYFQNPPGIENIISRVTGGSPSDIRGTLGVSGGTANLFLLNPSGIIFGPNARLDVGGSFVATTANAIEFGTRGFFSSSDRNPPPLLTVNPSAFFFNQVARGSIVNRSTAALAANARGLQVPDGRSLLFLGGDVSLAGGGMNAFGGRVELGGVAESGMVGLNVEGNNLHLSFPENVARADISLTDGAKVDASGEAGGTIQVRGRHVSLSGGSQMAAFTQGAKPGGNLSVNGSESVELLGYSPRGVLTTQTFGAGSAGDITIDTRKLIVRDGARVSTLTFGEGAAGQLTVNASESVELIGISSQGSNSGLFSSTVAAGDAGNLIVNTGRLIIRGRAAISTDSSVLVDTRSRVIRRATGRGGKVTVNASESVELTEFGLISTDTQGSGGAGDLTINTGRLLVQSGSILTTGSSRSGSAGNIDLNVSDTLQANNGTITTTAEQSSGGAIDITAGAIRLQDNSDISTFVSSGTGGGGNITLNARSIVALDDSDILAFSQDGRGGNITLETPAFFGENYRRALGDADPDTLDRNNRVDINATGAIGSGVITIPDVSLIQNSLSELPENRINTDSLLANSCIVRHSRRTQGRFTITGTGGLQERPGDAQMSSFPTVDVETLPTEGTTSSTNSDRPWQKGDPIVEPQGVYRLPNGKLVMSRECY
jgi:filamentous hemagglutinin family protein